MNTNTTHNFAANSSFLAISCITTLIACTIATAAHGQRATRILEDAGILGATVPATSVDPLSIEMLQNSAVRTTRKHFPRVTSKQGTTSVVRNQVVGKPNQQALGRYAEALIAEGSDGWKPVKKPNAPQNDLYRFKDGKLEGMQVKLHKDYKFATYLKDLEKDHLAEYFAVADDHVDQLKGDLLAKAKALRAEGLVDEAAKLEKHASRIVKIGATHAQIEKKFIMASLRGLCTSAAATAAFAAGTTILIDLAMLGFESMDGSLSGSVIEDRIVEASIKAGATGAVTAVAVFCGATPVGWVVVVGGAAAYITTEVAIYSVKEAFHTPVVSEDAIPYLLSGWKETSWQKK